MNWHLFAFVMALAISFVVTPWVRNLAIRLRVMVHPGGRRVHTRPMPLWGGIAIFAGYMLTCLALMKVVGVRPGIWVPMLGVLVSGAVVFTMGLLDDMKELSAAVQTGIIVGAALILMTFGVRIQYLSSPFGHVHMLILGGVASWIITLCWIFAVTKTIDFMDGLDGLAAGIGAIAAGVLAIMSFYDASRHPDQTLVALMAAALCGACVGFLRYNFNPAKIFMGTGGSQFIGFTLAAISIIGAFKATAAIAIALPILVFGVPIFDGVFVMVRRFIKRQPIYVADKSHLHHRLLKRGFSHKQAVIVIYGICFVCSAAFLVIFWLSRR